jgi:hypothetical protein
MNLQTLLLKAREYEKSNDAQTEIESGRLEFISKFPLSKIQNLSLDEYCSGTDKNSFCYWLEYKNILFGIGGGNASKFGIYKGKDGKYYTGAGDNKIILKGSELSKHFNKILLGIKEALELTKIGEISKIKKIDIPIWNMILQKILSIYYPDKFLLVGAVDVLMECAKDISIANVELTPKNLIEINYELKQKIDSLDSFKNWSYIKTGNLIWNTYYEETKRDYFILGSKYGPNNNQDISSEMINQSVVAVGFASEIDLTDYFNQQTTEIKNFLEKKGENQSSINALRVFLSLKAGDKIAIKASGSPRGKTPFLSIIAIAEVEERNGEIYSYHPEGLFHTVNVKYINTGIYKEFDLGGYGATIHKLKNPDHIKQIFESDYQQSSSNTEFDKILSKMNPADVEVYFNFLNEIIQKFDLKKGDKRIVFSLREKRLVFTAGQRYCWILRNNNQSSFGVIYPKKINKDSIKFGGKEPTPYYCTISVDEFNNLKKKYILTAVEKELKRSIKSSYLKSNNSDFENYVFQDKSKINYNNMQSMDIALNTIFYGPPGTGKTFQLNQYKENHFTDKDIKKTSDELLKEKAKGAPLWKLIGAILGSTNTPLSVKEIAQHPIVIAKSDTGKKTKANNLIWAALQTYANDESTQLQNKYRNGIKLFQKNKESKWTIAPDKKIELTDIIDQELLDIAVNPELQSLEDTTLRTRYNFITFHQKYSYEDFIEGIKPLLQNDEVDDKDGDLKFTLKKGIFYNSCLEALKLAGYDSFDACYSDSLDNRKEKFNQLKNDPKSQFALFIDEINRANISAVFGELITLLEDDKRMGASNEMWIELPYSNQKFCVPPNLFVIGTMNTADRSIALLDIALRRRFEFKALYPLYQEKEWWSKLLESLNQAIYNVKKNADFFIGHAFFMNKSINDKTQILNTKIIPLLNEYCQNNSEMVKRILSEANIQTQETTIKNNFQIIAE